MQKLNKYLVLLLLLGLSQTTFAQTLESLLASVDSNNLELKALHLEYLAALEKAPQVGQLPDPEAGLGLFALPAETRLGPQWVRLSATQMFPWKGTLNARKGIVLAMARARYEKIAATRLVLHYQVKTAYFQYYKLENQQRILQQSLALFKTLESVATTAVETGKAKLADVVRIQIRIRDLEEELNILENQKLKSGADINQLLNRPEDLPLSVMGTLELANPTYERTTLLSSIRENHPMIRMYSLQQETAQAAIDLNTLEGKPSFGIGIDYIAVGKRTDADPSHNGRDIIAPRVGVRIPLYRDKCRSKKQEELLKTQALEIRKQDQFLKFRSAINKAYVDLMDGQIRHRLYQEQKKSIQTAIDLLLTEYSTEGIGFIDLLQLENQLLQYDLMALDALLKTQVAQAEIERYIP